MFNHILTLLLFLISTQFLNAQEAEGDTNDAKSINLAGIFEGNQVASEAFNYAVESANEDLSEFNRIMTSHIDENIYPDDIFTAINNTCNLFETTQISAIFGPFSLYNIDAVQSICDEKEIPHILTRWLYNPVRSGTLVNFYPHSPILAKAYLDIIKSWDWNSFTVLYEDSESLLRISHLILSARDMNLNVAIEQLDKDQLGNYRPALKKVWRSGQKFFVIDCRTEHLYDVLLQCQQIGIMTSEYNYLITNLDMHTIDLMPFFYSETNITGIRLINPNDPQVIEVSQNIPTLQQTDIAIAMPSWKLTTETALIVDAVHMFAKVLSELNELEEAQLSCDNVNSWEYGYTLTNLLKTSSFRGLSGPIEFNNEGFRSSFNLQIYGVGESGLATIGNWNSSTGINITNHNYDVAEIDNGDDSLRNKSFTVIIALTQPYGMRKEESKALVGNDIYEGFGIDLIAELALMEGFNYTFILREDGKNGNKEEDGSWSGMIGDVREGRADLAITDLTITSERNDAVDFTSPFMNLGIAILFQKSRKAPPNFFSFAEPFALDTWIAMAVAFVVMSLAYFILGRICPSEWDNPYPCIEEPEYLINQYSFQNSVWFVTGAMLQQGSEMAPIAVPTRIVSGVWWFFILIMVASYTANLASFLVTENNVDLFTDINSLVKNQEEHKLRWGAKAGGATVGFFEKSDNEVYKTIYKHMQEHPEDMVKENKDGVAMAANEDINYAFFMESTSIEYETQRHCMLRMVGDRLDEKGYGIAMRKDSPYRNRLSTAVLKLQSNGFIERIRKKWWEERRGGGLCTGTAEEAAATPLDLRNVEGVFYVTIYGCFIAAGFVIIEYLIYMLRMRKRTRIPFKEIFVQEIKHYINFNSGVKPTVGSGTDSKSGSVDHNDDEDVLSNGEREKSNKSTSRVSEMAQTNGSSRVGRYGFIVTPSSDRMTNNGSTV